MQHDSHAYLWRAYTNRQTALECERQAGDCEMVGNRIVSADLFAASDFHDGAANYFAKRAGYTVDEMHFQCLRGIFGTRIKF